jgi:pimeloyl-ACP methyl ester carboxylesterase
MFTTRFAPSCFWAFTVLILSIGWLQNGSLWILWAFLLCISVYNFALDTLVGLSFLLPGRPKPTFEGEGWIGTSFSYDGKTVQTVAFTQQIEPAPLMIMVHGWRSSSSSVSDRALWFTDRGWHVVMIELPNHGSSDSYAVWSAYRSMLAVRSVCNNLEKLFSAEQVSSCFYYGHSIGGFIGLRLLSEQPPRVAGQDIKAMILESPMTMYEPILDEIATKLRVPTLLHDRYRRRLIAKFNASISQRGRFQRVEEFNVPEWGTPVLPLLCLQASPDQRLGMSHYERLLETYSTPALSHFLTEHQLRTLTHSGAKHNKEREQAIEAWLPKVL